MLKLSEEDEGREAVLEYGKEICSKKRSRKDYEDSNSQKIFKIDDDQDPLIEIAKNLLKDNNRIGAEENISKVITCIKEKESEICEEVLSSASIKAQIDYFDKALIERNKSIGLIINSDKHEQLMC